MFLVPGDKNKQYLALTRFRAAWWLQHLERIVISQPAFSFLSLLLNNILMIMYVIDQCRVVRDYMIKRCSRCSLFLNGSSVVERDWSQYA